MSKSQKLKHRDRVICTTNSKLKNKVFTVFTIPEYPYLKLYQMSENLLFTLEGICVQNDFKSLFRIGDTLEFYRSNASYQNK